MTFSAVAVTRVRNEGDIVEAFVRHTAAFATHHILLDNGSSDATLPILHALRSEGFPLTILSTDTAHFAEQQQNTALFMFAKARFAPDWVLCLDADEFIIGDVNNLRTCSGAAIISLPLIDYYPTPADDPADLLVTRRIRNRQVGLSAWKVFVRGSRATDGYSIEAGNHGVLMGGWKMPARQARGLSLGHFARRSPWQTAAKSVIGRLRMVATRRELAEGNLGHHYTGVLEHIRDDPMTFLAEIEAASDFDQPLVDRPVDYRGGELRYTKPRNEAAAAVSSVVAWAQMLAEQHQHLMDGSQDAQKIANRMALQWGGLERENAA